MRIVCSGNNKKVFETLFHLIGKSDDVFGFFKDGLLLLKSIVYDSKLPDLIILEYETYRNFTDFIYNVLKAKKLIIPVILIGIPELKSEALACHWLAENEYLYDVHNLHPMIPLFRKIADALDLSELKSLHTEDYVCDLFHSFENHDEAIQSPMEHFRQNKSFSPVIFNLLDYMYKNRSREVSLSEIGDLLNINTADEKRRKNIVYSYIARLRKNMNEKSVRGLKVLRTRTGYYKLFLR